MPEPVPHGFILLHDATDTLGVLVRVKNITGVYVHPSNTRQGEGQGPVRTYLSGKRLPHAGPFFETREQVQALLVRAVGQSP